MTCQLLQTEGKSGSTYCYGFETPSPEYIVYLWTHIDHRQVRLYRLNEVSKLDLSLPIYGRPSFAGLPDIN